MSDNNTSEIIPISIAEEMKQSYLDYAMSVIVSRAIPDARDGLKPVHRRILYAMHETGNDYNKPYRKSARIVGEVMGKYHPHGDSAIYDALVRMAQPFSMSLMLIDGQGNFGSMDGDSPAAMRYTESRLARSAHSLLEDLDKDTVNYQSNYDETEREPLVLPAMYPNLLVNGASGIAVGMATNIAPHNAGEVIDSTLALIDNPDISMDELMQICPGPDFPTGGIILGRSGAHSAMTTGRGSVIMRAKADIEEIRPGKMAIVIHEFPYQVNKAKFCERVGELVREKKIDGITEVRDESDKQGVRTVIELRKDAVGEVVLNQLYSMTPLQTSFAVNQLALNAGRPMQMDFKQVLECFVQFREEVITRRTSFLLNKARDRAHVLIGLAIAVANIDEVIRVIKAAKDPVEAREELMSRDWEASEVVGLLKLIDDSGNILSGDKIKFTEVQARAILELRLQRLTGMEREKIDEEMTALAAEIQKYLDILSQRDLLIGIMKSELAAVREQFAVPRRTEIQDAEFEHDIEDLIQKEDMVVTVTHGGYIKRTPLADYRAQRRGGKGKSSMNMKDEDMTTELLVVNTHTPVLFFSSAGKVYKLKVYRLPQGAANTRGKALVNIFPLAAGETITTFMPLPEEEDKWDDMNIFFATAKGNVRRNDLSDFHNVMTNGKIAIGLADDDSLVDVRPCMEDDHVMLAAKSGKCIRCPVSAVRVFKSRKSDGVRGIKLKGDDEVVSMTILSGTNFETDERVAYLKAAAAKRRAAGEDDSDEGISDEEASKDIALSAEQFASMEEAEQMILTVTENGFGKRSSAFEYRITNRGGSGLTNIVTSARNGSVIASLPVEEDDEIMLLTDKATVIRTRIKDIRIAGRNTQGVTILKTGKGEKVVSVVRVPEGSGDDEVEASDDENTNSED